MRWIYLSPHLDDAALSAGGLIYEQTRSGVEVEIWTFMCGFPRDGEYSQFAEENHAKWGFSSAEETVRARRAEDVNAANILGAKFVHFDFLDCIYRRGRNKEWLYREISVPPHEEDADIPAQIASAISTRVAPDDVLVCQLTVGSHVDHVLVRNGAELIGWSLRYIIDVPYVFYKPQDVDSKSVGMEESVYSVSEAGLRSWQDAVSAYTSQFPVLGDAFDTPEKARESIRSYWATRKGIRLWKTP